MRVIGNSGLEVGSIGLGGMPLSLEGRPDEADSVRVIHAALDAGMTLIDTADVYCLDDSDIGHNERLIAKALRLWRGERDRIVVATKGGLRRPGGAWVTSGQPRQIRDACERSLKALDLDCIALYQLHAPDPQVPLADSVGEMARLQAEGKIRHVGLSNVEVAEIEQARRIVEVASVQNRFNPLDGERPHDGVIAYCHQEGIAYLPHSSVGGHNGHARLARHPTISCIAQELRASPYQVTLAWLLALSPVMIPIPGASRVESALSSAAAADLELTADQIEQLEQMTGLSPL